MKKTPFATRMDLPGWRLFWATLTWEDDHKTELAVLRQRITAQARARYTSPSDISSNPTVKALRRLFKEAGCDPSRYRPASEALLRRLVKGNDMPEIHPLVDINNCLSAELAVPCCVMVDGSFGSSLVWRAGVAGESYLSLRGPFNLEGKPLLLDEEGPLDAPITGSQRVMVKPDTRRAWLVAYLPEAELSVAAVWDVLSSLVSGTGVVAEASEQAC